MTDKPRSADGLAHFTAQMAAPIFCSPAYTAPAINFNTFKKAG